MGRPPLPPRRAIGLRIPVELHEALEAESIARDLSMNDLIVRAIKYFLPRLVPVEESFLILVPDDRRPPASSTARALEEGP